MGKFSDETSPCVKVAAAAAIGSSRRLRAAMTGNYFLRIAFVCLGFAVPVPAAWSQDAATASPPPPPARQTDPPPPAAVPQEPSHEEIVREQERRDRAAEDERDRDDL